MCFVKYENRIFGVSVILNLELSMALFSNRREQSSPFLIEFRAGKMQLRGTTVYPDHRKGLVYVHQSEDSLMHFCWKDRTTGVDLILFPEDVEFVPVPQCNSGRVFLLKFKNSNRRMFFWMQEPQSNRDEEYCRRVNELLNNPPALGSSRRGEGGRSAGGLHELTDHLGFMNQLLNLSSARRGGKKKTGISGAATSAEERMDWQSSLSGINQSQLVELLNLMGSGSQVLDQSGLESLNAPFLPMIEDDHSMIDASEQPVESTQGKESASATQGNQIKKAAGEGTAQIKVEDLRSIFSSLSGNATTYNTGARAQPINLDTVFTPKALSKILSKKQYVERLCEHIPKECEKNYNEIETTLRSPQFIQCLRVFSKALQAGHLAPVFEQFRFPESVIRGCQKGDIIAVFSSMEQDAKKSKADNKEKKNTESPSIAAVFALSKVVALSAAEGGLEGCVFGFGTFCSKDTISFFSSKVFHKLYMANICFSISKMRSVSTEISANQLFMSLPSSTKAMCKQARAI
ncbi:Proteasomal ubiquitin receptor ADRM1 [Trichinella nelsoni]|uniref:Proteasomal ubiquitin receptor ADRM1 homolog n=1 Tax=Trichinella nelsoni TaxID=6336 RepID=A0A0V0S4W3_9BILA|nr:Proteasomal ubiquitin receptor ADRM1 [Trichinella nelsoni]